MVRDEGLHLRQLDPLVHADRLGRQIRRQSGSAARALAGTVIDDPIGRLAHGPAVALVAGLGAAGLGLLPLLLAIRRGRLGGGARGLLWPLQPQHQLDQLFLAQTLKLAAAHPGRESAIQPRRKGVGNYAFEAFKTSVAAGRAPLKAQVALERWSRPCSRSRSPTAPTGRWRGSRARSRRAKASASPTRSCPRRCVNNFRWRRSRHSLENRRGARRLGLRLSVRKVKPESGDMAPLQPQEATNGITDRGGVHELARPPALQPRPPL